MTYAESNKEFVKAAEISKEIAVLYVKQKDYFSALNYFENELRYRNKIIDTGINIIEKSKAYFNCISFKRVLAFYDDANQLAKKALDYNIRYFGNDSPETADAYKQQAEIALLSKKPELFTYAIEKAINIRKKCLDFYSVADLLILNSGIYNDFGDTEEAEKIILKAKTYFDKSKTYDKKLKARLYSALGSVFTNNQKYSTALQYLKSALDIRLGDSEKSEGVAWLYDNMGVLYYKLENYSTSLVNYDKSLIIFKSILGENNPKVMQVLANKAASLVALDSIEAAKSILFYLLRNGKENSVNFSLRQLAEIEEKSGNNKKAEFYYKKVKDAFEKNYLKGHPILAELYFDIGKFYGRISEKKKSVEYFLRSLDVNQINTKVLNSRFYLRSLKELFFLNAEINRDQIDIGISICSNIFLQYKNDSDRILILNLVKNFYESLLYYLSTNQNFENKNEYIYRAFEGVKSILLTSSMNDEQFFKLASVPPQVIDDYKKIRFTLLYYEQQTLEALTSSDSSNISELNFLVIKYQNEFDKISKLLASKYNVKQFEFKNSSLIECNRKIKNDELILDYFMGDTMLFILEIAKSHFRLKKHNINTLKDLNVYYESLFDLSAIEQNVHLSLSNFIKETEYFSRILISQDLLNKNFRYITIIPDEQLYYLPFEILFFEKAKSNSFRELPYLLKKYNIRYLYGLKFIKKENFDLSIDYSINTIAPLYNFETELHHPLPSALIEIKKLNALYSGNSIHSKPITKKDFLNAIKNKHTILHIAAHAVAPDNSDAFLLFSDTNLKIYEIMSLNLDKVPMIVLSACQTGMGQFKKGEGLMSLGRAFAYASIPSSLTTLWPLHDRSAPDLMLSFYKYLDNGNNKSEAMRLAKIDFLKEAGNFQSHPLFWSSPVIWGDDSPIIVKKKYDFTWIYVFFGFICILSTLLFLRKRFVRL